LNLFLLCFWVNSLDFHALRRQFFADLEGMDKASSSSSASSVKTESGLSQEDERIREFQNNPNVPADAKVMALLLRSSGVTDYDPKIINQLLDFMHRASR
jgi:hypothetical protein